ncbi:hypothetical protein SLNHY_3937 [Streptomyces albus]|nr:hypothetical protein SLNHY_3937 [Streptomyces albus]
MVSVSAQERGDGRQHDHRPLRHRGGTPAVAAGTATGRCVASGPVPG